MNIARCLTYLQRICLERFWEAAMGQPASIRSAMHRVEGSHQLIPYTTCQNRIKSVNELGAIRMSTMQEFLESYELAKEKGTYIPGALPKLNFANDSFDIALCSHFLFLYTDNLGYQFHYDSILEMMRVAQEARIFLLLNFNARQSRFVDKIINDLASHDVEIREVDYEFQIGGNKLMVVSQRDNI